MENEIGLENRYRVIKRSTGLEVDEACFVLKPSSDLAAREALMAYAANSQNYELSKDLVLWIKTIEAIEGYVIKDV